MKAVFIIVFFLAIFDQADAQVRVSKARGSDKKIALIDSFIHGIDKERLLIFQGSFSIIHADSQTNVRTTYYIDTVQKAVVQILLNLGAESYLYYYRRDSLIKLDLKSPEYPYMEKAAEYYFDKGKAILIRSVMDFKDEDFLLKNSRDLLKIAYHLFNSHEKNKLE